VGHALLLYHLGNVFILEIQLWSKKSTRYLCESFVSELWTRTCKIVPADSEQSILIVELVLLLVQPKTCELNIPSLVVSGIFGALNFRVDDSNFVSGVFDAGRCGR